MGHHQAHHPHDHDYRERHGSGGGGGEVIPQLSRFLHFGTRASSWALKNLGKSLANKAPLTVNPIKQHVGYSSGLPAFSVSRQNRCAGDAACSHTAPKFRLLREEKHDTTCLSVSNLVPVWPAKYISGILAQQ